MSNLIIRPAIALMSLISKAAEILGRLKKLKIFIALIQS